jgi:hypothetical protein
MFRPYAAILRWYDWGTYFTAYLCWFIRCFQFHPPTFFLPAQRPPFLHCATCTNQLTIQCWCFSYGIYMFRCCISVLTCIHRALSYCVPFTLYWSYCSLLTSINSSVIFFIVFMLYPSSCYVPLNFSPTWFSWTFLMAYSEKIWKQWG